MSDSRYVSREDLLSSIPQKNKNNFLVIVGKNGEGKSRYLNKLIEQSSTSYHGFDNIIATSTSIFEIFPTKITLKNDNKFIKYNYFGTKSVVNSKNSNRNSSNLIVSACLSLLRRFHENNTKNHNYNNIDDSELRYVFSTINFRPIIEFIIKVDPEINSYRDVFDGVTFTKRNGDIISEDDPIRVQAINDLLDRLKKCSDRNNNVRLGYTLGKAVGLFQTGIINDNELETLLWLTDNEILRILDVRFSKIMNDLQDDWYSMRLASSGEQCIIMTLIGIASAIRDHSLIFIDEPEISLHPEWQEKFIELLNKAFKQYEGCLFIIATHSPQLISKLPEKNSFIYNLAKEVLSTSNGFSHRSSDYQLANIFNSPGVNNEYLSRILITWLVKFSKNESPSDSEKTEIKEVLKLKKLLSDSDPVKRLMLMVEDTMGSI